MVTDPPFHKSSICLTHKTKIMQKYLTLVFVLVLCCHMAVTPSSAQVGYPDRDSRQDALPGFRSPPAGYGEVPFYWWMGDTLTREHLTAHLDLLKGRGISSLQVNYAHSDKGGKLWGLTYKSKPEIFTDEWWELFGWFMREARKRGMTVSLSDYTLGVGQEQYVDHILADHPEVTGSELRFLKQRAQGSLHWELPGQNTELGRSRRRLDGHRRPCVSQGTLL